MTKLQAILRTRCPRCREGKVFSGIFRMNAKCPVCGLVFEREPGYFLGSMYLSYGMGGLLVVACVLALDLLTSLTLPWFFGIAAVLLWVCTPLIYRYSRVIFMTLERNTFGDDA